MTDKKITGYTEESVPITTDMMEMVDDPGGSAANKKVQIGNLIKGLDITALTASTAADAAADYLVIYDGSEMGIRKQLLKYIRGVYGYAWLSARGGISRTTNGAAAGQTELSSNKQNVPTLDFDKNTIEYAQWWTALKGWDGGTVTAIFVWMHPATTTNFDVIWGLQGISYANDEALDAAFGTAQEVTDTGGTTTDAYFSGETSAITLAGTPADGELVCFQAYRKASDGSDTLAVDAKLIGILVKYTRATA